MEDRARRSIGQYYDEGVVQLVENVGEVVEDERGKRFKVNESYDAIKERWLKERTVIFIFQDEARDLTRSVKEDLIRAHEDGWMSRRLSDPSIRRGRIKFEGPNVISYVAKAIEVSTWLIQKATIKLGLRGKEYSVLVRPWMTKPELKELKLREAETNFWIVALRVPLDAMCYLPSAAKGLFGGVKCMLPPEADRTKPKLMNIKLDMDPMARFRVENSLTIESPKGELWTVDIATPYSDRCKKCRWYFHTEEECPKQGEAGPRRSWTNSRLPPHRPTASQQRTQEPRQPTPVPSQQPGAQLQQQSEHHRMQNRAQPGATPQHSLGQRIGGNNPGLQGGFQGPSNLPTEVQGATGRSALFDGHRYLQVAPTYPPPSGSSLVAPLAPWAQPQIWANTQGRVMGSNQEMYQQLATGGHAQYQGQCKVSGCQGAHPQTTVIRSVPMRMQQEQYGGMEAAPTELQFQGHQSATPAQSRLQGPGAQGHSSAQGRDPAKDWGGGRHEVRKRRTN
ncbi:hypothetical protein CBR_g36648 [Chara braunii]|uniref:DUF4283 domain-containing protein n=1 Tax=Chara braunii TaxID=69332 RepID=A0A388LL26_CHABU|nr:hypothetical protein CBR_g36648 [Chara braunii]|eukprot:GBG83030.1 hypothetical protein CBR_g36648 [Chara braunii]